MLQANKTYAGFNPLLLSPSHSVADTDGASLDLSFEAAYVTNLGGGKGLMSRELSDAERRCGGFRTGWTATVLPNGPRYNTAHGSSKTCSKQ